VVRQELPGQDIILFDGVCNLCNRSVIFVLQNDPGRVFRFASIQSATGAALLEGCGLPADFNKTVIYLEKGIPYFNSTAALRIAGKLAGPWPVLARIGLLVPRPLRDGVYNVIARNRYHWFGRRDSCLVPTQELSSRFL
jgi:predicted DCC family thiol-disulfide oxidoreductase YuxK